MTASNPSLSTLATDLIQLALEKSSEKRIELLRSITDAYLATPDDHSPAEQYLLNDIVDQLMSKIKGPDRAAASETLSHLPNLPGTLTRNLATDEDIQIARPILQNHRGVTEATLIEVAETASQDHLQAIASRQVITIPVTDVIVGRGNNEVVRTLAANHGAQFSSQGMQTLIERSEADTGLQALLVDRNDITLEAVGKLLPIISGKLAARLRCKETDFDYSKLSAQVASVVKDRNKSQGRIDSYIDSLKKGDLKLNSVAMEMVSTKRLLDVTTVFAALVDLDRYHAFNILTQGKKDMVLMLLKALDLPWPIVEKFLWLRQEKFPSNDLETPATATDYEMMTVQASQRVVRFMKVRRAAAGGDNTALKAG